MSTVCLKMLHGIARHFCMSKYSLVTIKGHFFTHEDRLRLFIRRMKAEVYSTA